MKARSAPAFAEATARPGPDTPKILLTDLFLEQHALRLRRHRLWTIFLDACGIIIQHRIHAGADAPAPHGFRPKGFQKIEKRIGFSEARIEPQIVVFSLQNDRHAVVYS